MSRTAPPAAGAGARGRCGRGSSRSVRGRAPRRGYGGERPPDETRRVHSEGLGHEEELQRVHRPLAWFDHRNVRCGLSQLDGEIPLRDGSLEAGLSEHRRQRVVFWRVDWAWRAEDAATDPVCSEAHGPRRPQTNPIHRPKKTTPTHRQSETPPATFAATGGLASVSHR